MSYIWKNKDEKGINLFVNYLNEELFFFLWEKLNEELQLQVEHSAIRGTNTMVFKMVVDINRQSKTTKWRDPTSKKKHLSQIKMCFVNLR